MKANKMKFQKLVVSISAVLMAGAAMAATDSANLTVGATVQNACAIGTGSLNFGTLALEVNSGLGTVTGTNHDANSGTSISIACTNGASATITADLGGNATGSTRRMKSGDDLLSYELYSGAYENVLNASNGIAYTGTGSATTDIVIRGRVAAGELSVAKKGSYTDTVAMTITYEP